MKKSSFLHLPLTPALSPWKGRIVAILATATCTLIGLAMRSINPVNVVMLYLLGIELVAMRYGREPSMWMVILSVLSFYYVIVPPYFSFELNDLSYLFTFAIMLFTGFIISGLTSKIMAEKAYTELKERNTAALYAVAHELAYTRGRENIMQVIRRHIEEVLDVIATLWLMGEDGRIFCVTYPQLNNDLKEKSAARFAYENACLTGPGTQRLEDVDGYYIPLKASGSVFGVLGVLPKKHDSLKEDVKAHLQTVANLTTSVLESVDFPVEETNHPSHVKVSDYV